MRLKAKKAKKRARNGKSLKLCESGFGEEGEAQAVRDYIKYEVSIGAGGAQGAAEGQDYLGDPKMRNRN